MNIKTMLSEEHAGSRDGLLLYVNTLADCDHPDSTLEQRQAARVTYLLMLGIDMPASKHFVDPPTGALYQTGVFCHKMREKLPDEEAAKDMEKQKRANDIVNKLTFAGEALGHGPLALMAAVASYQGMSLLPPGLIPYWLFGAAAFGKDRLISIFEKLKNVNKIASDLGFPNGMSDDDIEARTLFWKDLRKLDIAVYRARNDDPEYNLQWVIDHAEAAGMKDWKKAAKVFLRAFKSCGDHMSVESAQCFRRELVNNDNSKLLYKASMVFDSAGRLRSNGDAVRAFHHIWLKELKRNKNEPTKQKERKSVKNNNGMRKALLFALAASAGGLNNTIATTPPSGIKDWMAEGYGTTGHVGDSTWSGLPVGHSTWSGLDPAAFFNGNAAQATGVTRKLSA